MEFYDIFAFEACTDKYGSEVFDLVTCSEKVDLLLFSQLSVYHPTDV